MQDTSEFRTNRDLFSNHYLDEHLPETDAWESVDATELREAYDDIVDLWERERDLVADRNESQLEEKFIRPMFRKLDVPFEVEESVEQGQRRPDYGFFESDEAARNAFARRRDGGDFYKNAVAVADAKRWGRKLDTRGEQQRDFENPSYQIHVYLQETPATWAVLTNGEYWRLYYGPTSHRLDSYYEIHLPTVLESGDLEAFKYFYLFFRHEAFLPDASGDCFLDDVYSESNVFAEELGEDLQNNIYDAIQSLAEGFLTYPENDLGADDLDLIHDSSLIYLYRLIFVLYAESEGRDLLNTDNEIYERSYSLNTIKQEVAEELDSDSPSYQSWQSNLWDQIDGLFQLIDQGSASREIPKEDLHIPAYNGGLFRTNPDPDDSRETRFLATQTVGDEYLARVIELLTRSRTGSSGKIFVDYSSLDVRHLGSIYEGLLEYQLNVADDPLTLDEGEYVLADGGAAVAVEPGEVYLTTDSGERKATGSYYTPEYVVEYIVENTLEPLVEGIREDLAGNVSYDNETGFAEEFAERIFELKVLDPAMGSGHFLTNTIDYLAREIIDAQERQAEQQGVETVGQGQDINWARRQVAQHCIYGVDLNPLAVELAKVSLWLRTLAAEQPLAFLDHHLKTGNSLVGSDIESIDELETDANGGPNASLADFGAVRRGTIDHLMDVYEEFIAIENTDLADAKEMERKYREIERDDLRTRLVAMANVKTAEDFDLDLPSGAYERMARALDSDSEWVDVEATDWYQSAQAVAVERNFLHWKLEFPEVFYEVDGSDQDNPGFDAVIGNPPYIRIQTLSGQGSNLKNYLNYEYVASKGKYDLYVLFVELSSNLLRNSGFSGMIVPNKFLQSDYGAALRGLLVDQRLPNEIVDFGDEQVFSDISTYTSLVFLQGSLHPAFEYEAATPSTIDESATTGVDFDNISSEPWNIVVGDEKEVLDTLLSMPRSLSDVAEELYQGIITGGDDHFILSEIGSDTQTGLSTVKRRDTGEEFRIESDLLKPFVKGANVRRYQFDEENLVLLYPYEDSSGDLIKEETLESEYPYCYTYLSEFSGELSSRGSESMEYPTWYAQWCPRSAWKFERSKIVTPVMAERGRYLFDEKGVYFNGSGGGGGGAYGIIIDENSVSESPLYVTGILNSTMSDFVIHNISSVFRGEFYAYNRQYIEKIPIKEIGFGIPDRNRVEAVENGVKLYQESAARGDWENTRNWIEDCSHEGQCYEGILHDLLKEFVTEIGESHTTRRQLNLRLFDYLGTYKEGQTLGKLYQPPAGLVDSILTDTTEERANLKFGRVTVADDGGKLVVRATARYKPENPDEHETDRWDYTETDPEPAMEFVGLSDAERALIRAFVPHATDEAGGFAGFRETATKTNSLVDRLEALTLPALSDVEDGLERYRRQKERAEELDEKIEKTDELIDQIVYQLYGLTDEEIEIVEEAVGDD